MNTVNVIVIFNGNIQQLVAFPDNYYGNSKATNTFEQFVKGQDFMGDVTEYLDCGVFNNGKGTEILIVHSNSESIPSFNNDSIQFPRLIDGLEEVGAFTPEVIQKLMEEMNLTESEIMELIDRGQVYWDEIKSNV